MATDPQSATLTAGQHLGPYEVLAPIGAGGMGEVYRARDTRLGRDVAIKVLPGDLSRDRDRLRRFEQEARAASSINHANILTVYDVGAHDCGPYIVFELLEGKTLRELLAGGGLPLPKAVDYAAQIARGLAAAHEKGIVHRDLKPENLFITDDEVAKILDFGLAKLVRHEALLAENPEAATLTHATEAGTMLGTVGYMSPEQVRGQRADHRSDIFSFGAILYEMLSGHRAFGGGPAVEVLSAIIRDEAPDLPAALGSIPPALNRIVRQCLEKNPDKRFQSARDLAFQLRSLAEPSAPAAGTGYGGAAQKRVMIVVLPFENLSDDPEQEYFSAGLTEETISDLGGLASDRLGVIARTSAMSYRGTRKSIAEIGRDLGVDFAVEGSVRRQADRVRISVQLIRTNDQTQVWARQYDRDLKDVLSVQDELGRAIAEQVQVKLTADDAGRRAAVQPLDQAAYDAYLHGRFHLWRVTRPDLERALEYFRRATELDPRMAAAYAGLAQTYVVMPIAAGAAPRDAFPRAEQAAGQALGIDPDSVEAHAAMVSLRHWHNWDWAAAERHARRAIGRNANHARAHQVLGRLLTNVGRHDEAIAEIDIAARLDPLAPLIIALSADFRLEARRYGEVEPLIRRALELDPNFWVAHVSAAKLYLHQGRHDEALAAAERARTFSGGHSEALALLGLGHGAAGRTDRAREVLSELERRGAAGYVPATHLAAVQLGTGDAGQAMRWLERAFDERDVWLTELGVEPRWDALRAHPGFQDLIRRIGFPAAPAVTITPAATSVADDAPRLASGSPALPGRPRRRPGAVAVTGVAVALAAVAALVWSRVHESRVRWARETAVAEVARLQAGDDLVGAYRVARRALAAAPDDSAVKQALANLVHVGALTSDPPGAEVEIRSYLGTDNRWVSLGVTPFKEVAVPVGFLRWRLTKPGYEPLEVGQGLDTLEFKLVPTGSSRPGMVVVPKGSFQLESSNEDVQLPDYWLDRYEVTNREYKAFVDGGGYRRREFWKEPFVKDGRPLTWEDAMAAFRDTTGRPGPATWELGTYPEGQDGFPVGGVSWYEAAAYAAFAGKQLPTAYHWYRASGAFGVFSEIVAASNFSGKGPVKVGSTGGLGPYGTYDMAGNVKEWCWNATSGGRRYLLGGAWNEATYTFRDEDAQSPFERKATFGFRCMLEQEPIAQRLAAEIKTFERDPASLKPVGDEVFRAYLRLYDYDRTPLDAKSGGVDDSDPAWRKELVSVRAAYGDERLPIYVFVPKSATPPYQPIVYSPASDATHTASSQHLWLQLADYLVRSGRVLVYPVYKGTYERRVPGPKGPNVIRDLYIEWGKDLRRTVDYLETRSDIDASKVSFYGLSLGAQLGPLFLAIEPRFRTGVFFSGGFETWDMPPEVDPVNFAPRVKAPVLMVNGREDFDLPYATAQVPMFRMLGTPEADKRHVVLEGGHIPPHPQEAIKVVLNWLDDRLGPVK
ncbi:MAG: protein kinase [Acidobacteriia bacterium]|nr:protein kinase [Terriglobia bacterium]